MRRTKGIDPSDLVAAAAGAAIGLAVGLIAGGSVGRLNRARIQRAMKRFKKGQPAPKVWTYEEAERLEARVLDALSGDVVLARRPIRVAVLGMGLVELTGTVMHTAEVGLASDIVQQVEGVRTVLNHLLVEGVDRAVVPVSGPHTPRAARG